MIANPSNLRTDELRDYLRDLSNHQRTSTRDFWAAARELARRQTPKPEKRK